MGQRCLAKLYMLAGTCSLLIGNHSHASINSYMDKSVPLPQEMVCTLEVIVQGSEESRATTGASQEI